MRKFAIASLLVAGVALTGSVFAQSAAPQAASPQAAPATKPAAAQPAAPASSTHHKKSKKPTQISGQPGATKGGKSAKRTAKNTVPPVTSGPST